MQAREQTEQMLEWWCHAGITHADVAVRRATGKMIWQHDRRFDQLPMAWMRAENVHGAEIYIRPARGYCWPLLFLDDVSEPMMRRVLRCCATLAIRTSPEGGYHIWLRTRLALCEAQRAQAQRWLAERTGADPASISGEHLGRLAGFKNWKRGGVWVNVFGAAPREKQPWDPGPSLQGLLPVLKSPLGHHPTASAASPRLGRDTSPSGQDWAWTCRQLEAAAEPIDILRSLIQRAAPRRRADATRYARLTLQRALARTSTRRFGHSGESPSAGPNVLSHP